MGEAVRSHELGVVTMAGFVHGNGNGIGFGDGWLDSIPESRAFVLTDESRRSPSLPSMHSSIATPNMKLCVSVSARGESYAMSTKQSHVSQIKTNLRYFLYCCMLRIISPPDLATLVAMVTSMSAYYMRDLIGFAVA